MIEVQAFGSPQILVDGKRVSLPKKQVALLSYLTLGSANGLCRRDTLIGMFWPEQSQSAARAALRQPLSAFRRELGHDVIVARGDEEVGLDRSLVRCDVLVFDNAVKGGELMRAVSIYKGPLLDGLYIKGCREFDDWLDNERLPRARSFEEAVERLAAAARAEGDHRRAVELLRTLVFNDPSGERGTVLLMESLEEAGQRAEALRFGDRYVDLCRRDWAAEPGPRVLELLRRIRTQPLAISVPTLTDATRADRGVDSFRDAVADRYRLLGEIGRSHLATVWVAQDLKLHRQVAIKVLNANLTANLEDHTRFIREINFLARLNHPNIVMLLDADELDGFVYYVMSYVEGPTLRDVIRQQRYLEVQDAIRTLTQIAGALEYAHGHGVLHRDVKPENILIHEGLALLADFGVSLAIGGAGGERLTRTGQIIGTPEYMSPEQATGRDHDVRADVYALSCVLYEMLTGEPVFTGATSDIVIRRQQFSEPASPRVVRPKISAGLERVVLRGLSKDPEDRFPTPSEFAEAAEQNASPGAFVFVSYSRSDRYRLSNVVHVLRELGHDVWYDDAIPLSAEWDAEIAKMIEQCTLMVLLLSQAAVDSKHVRREVKFADECDKPIVVMQLEETDLRHGLQISLPRCQMLDATSGQVDSGRLDIVIKATAQD